MQTSSREVTPEIVSDLLASTVSVAPGRALVANAEGVAIEIEASNMQIVTLRGKYAATEDSKGE